MARNSAVLGFQTGPEKLLLSTPQASFRASFSGGQTRSPVSSDPAAPGGALVLIQTRWHEDDLPGRLLREHADENWEVISMPAVAEVDDEFRKAGEALWPERF